LEFKTQISLKDDDDNDDNNNNARCFQKKQYVKIFFFLLSVGLPVVNAPDVLQPCGLLYLMFKLSPPVVSPRDPGNQRWS